MKFLETTYDELARELKLRYGKGSGQAAAIYRDVFKNGKSKFSSLPRSAQMELELTLSPVVEEKRKEETLKFITRLRDGLEIESVIVPMTRHKTICISSQAGCRMGCSFCETGRMGFYRNLTVEEIVGQVYTGRFVLGGDIKNIVFMGMGEPLDNLDNVIQAIRVLNDQRGLDFAHRHITISSCGMVGGIEKLARLNWPHLHLAISLNASNDTVRSVLMPVNRAFSMAAIKQCLLQYPLTKSGVFFIEYILIKNINDSPDHARELAAYLKPLPVRVNLIPCNPCASSSFTPPAEEKIKAFYQALIEEKLFVRTRVSRGQNIRAGCGQLGNRQLRCR